MLLHKLSPSPRPWIEPVYLDPNNMGLREKLRLIPNEIGAEQVEGIISLAGISGDNIPKGSGGSFPALWGAAVTQRGLGDSVFNSTHVSCTSIAANNLYFVIL